MKAQLWVIAGPNGSGKSTVVKRYLAGKLPVINPDDIARIEKVGPIQAGRLAIERQNRLLMRGKSFAFETTLSGKRELWVMQNARERGYKLNVIFLALDGPALAVGRISGRVLAGGHDVPTRDVLRRFQRSIENLPAALAMADRAFVFDNSGDRRRLLLSLDRGKVKMLRRDLPEWAKPYLSQYRGQDQSRTR
ncbi:MAG: AAA family ATPase [Burkholderia sp.]